MKNEDLKKLRLNKPKDLKKDDDFNKQEKLKEFIDILVEKSYSGSVGFWDPLFDVGRTLLYGIETMSAATKQLFKGIIAQIPTLIVPGLKFNYQMFKQDHDQILKNIESKYSDVLSRNLMGVMNRDLWAFSFLLNPSLVLGFRLGLVAPMTALRTLEVLTGGDPRVAQLRQFTTLPDRPFPQDPMGGPGSWSSGGAYMDFGGGYGDIGGFGESIERLKEAEQNPNINFQQKLKELLNDPTIQSKIKSNPMIQDIQQQGMNLWITQVNDFMKLNNLEQMKQHLGPSMDKIIKNVRTSVERNPKLKNQDKQKIEAEIIKQIKTQYKLFYINQLTNIAKQVPGIAAQVQKVISTINSIK